MSDLNISKDQRKKHRPYYNGALENNLTEMFPLSSHNIYFIRKFKELFFKSIIINKPTPLKLKLQITGCENELTVSWLHPSQQFFSHAGTSLPKQLMYHDMNHFDKLMRFWYLSHMLNNLEVHANKSV